MAQDRGRRPGSSAYTDMGGAGAGVGKGVGGVVLDQVSAVGGEGWEESSASSSSSRSESPPSPPTHIASPRPSPGSRVTP